MPPSRKTYTVKVAGLERRLPGRKLDFGLVHDAIASHLKMRVQSKALMQYVRVLAGKAEISGVDLDATAVPLLQ